MAVKTVHVSDISGKRANEDQLGKLTIREHPEYTSLPITLEVLPKEIGDLKSVQERVQIEYLAPGARRPECFTISVEDFNALAPEGRMSTAIMKAISGQHAEQGTAGPRRC